MTLTLLRIADLISRKLVRNCISILSLDCFWLLDLLLDFTSNQIMPTLLKDLKSGPPKPAESLPERMDGKQCTKLYLRVNLFFVGMRFSSYR